MTRAVETLVSQLVAIDSINPDLVPGGAGETAIARFVAQWLEEWGFEVAWDEPKAGRPNVVGIARGSGGGRSLMLNAHMDTVGVTGMEHPHEPRVEGNLLYGRGAYDMKGGLAAILLAAAQAKQRGLRGDVIVTAVADEEYASIGTDSVVKRWHADAAIVTEATALDLCLAHKGFVWLEVEVTGKAAHGSRPEVGVDAIVKMGKVLTGLEQLQHMLAAKPAHPLLGHGSLHASLITGGQELSSYPERCLLSIERRTLPEETPAVVLAEIQRILEPLAAADPTFVATARVTLAREGYEIPADAPIVQAVRGAATARLGAEPEEFGAAWWMDSAILGTSGIPTVIFGPAGDGAHAAVEWVDLDSVERCVDVLVEAIANFCN
ncbi:MAG TPA: ArgE/DapE family deacylase [Ktedonobacterales bacterium]|nr:ArgE/DapE family deacylase [Ktedonobacterales bacterium]